MSSYKLKVDSHSRFGDIHFRVLAVVIVLGFFFLYLKVWRPEYVPKAVTDYFWTVFWVVLLLNYFIVICFS